MATPNTLVLDSANLPSPSEFVRKVGKRIAQRRLADGSLDEVGISSAKYEFRIKWSKLSETERDTIQTKFLALQGGSTVSFTDIEGDSYTVGNAEGQDEIEWEYYVSAGTIYYRGYLRLRQI